MPLWIRHAQLALVALTMELDSYGLGSHMTVKHTAAAVKVLRQRVQNASGIPENSLVGAVALLLIIEVSFTLASTRFARVYGLSIV